jgi:hypothetical protein
MEPQSTSSEAWTLQKKYSLDTTQTAVVTQILERDSVLLVAPKGAGKTRIGLAIAAESCGGCLIFCPNKVRQGWVDEAAKIGLSVQLIEGKPLDRIAQLRGAHPVKVLGVDLLPWFVDTFRRDLPVAGIIIDETTRFSAPGSRGVKKLRTLRKQLDWVLGLTASPVMEDPMALYGQALVIDGGKALGRNFDRFKATYFASDFMGHNFELLPGADAALAAAVSDLVLVADSRDYEASLPALHEQLIRLPMGAAQTAAYDEMCETLATAVEGEEVEAPNAAVMAGKLQQITAGFLYCHDEVAWLATEKFSVLRDVLAATDEPVVIVYQFIAEREMLQAMFPAGKDLNAPGAKAAFCAGDIPLLFMHPASGGHGVDGLQAVCRRMIFLGPIWSADKWDQSIGRILRRGQTRECYRTVFVLNDTIDETVLARVLAKAETEDQVMRHVRAHKKAP